MEPLQFNTRKRRSEDDTICRMNFNKRWKKLTCFGIRYRFGAHSTVSTKTGRSLIYDEYTQV